MNRHQSRVPSFALSRSDAVRKLCVKALGRAGQRAMEVAKDEHFDKGLLAHGERYGMDLSEYTGAMRKRPRKNKRLSPVCLNSPRLDADA
jgi:hypothetical protein